jgi:hypothetical protein
MSIGYKRRYHATRNHYTPDAQRATDVQKDWPGTAWNRLFPTIRNIY